MSRITIASRICTSGSQNHDTENGSTKNEQSTKKYGAMKHALIMSTMPNIPA
jgi:hypothetical protein